MSDTTRLLRQSGVAKSDDVNRLRAIVQMNIARASAGQVGVRGSHGSVFRQSQGFKTSPYTGRVALPTFPFQAYLSSPTEIKINASSRLYKSISTTDTLTVSALSTAITLASNTCVWVRVTVSSLVPSLPVIISGTAYPALIVTSGSPSVQTQFNIPLGKVTATNTNAPGFEFNISGTAYHFEQCLFSHLLVENRAQSGVPIIYAFPYSGA